MPRHITGDEKKTYRRLAFGVSAFGVRRIGVRSAVSACTHRDRRVSHGDHRGHGGSPSRLSVRRSAFTSDPRFASFRVFRGRIFLFRFQNHGLTFARSVDVPRRTRRSASTVGGVPPDVTIERAAADRAGARPYQPRAPIRRYVSSPLTPIRRPADTFLRLSLLRAHGFQLAFSESVSIRIWILRRRAFGEVIGSRFLIAS